jgi:hypothetical protein
VVNSGGVDKMKKLAKSLFVFVAAGVIAVGCEEVFGILTVDETITLKGDEERNSFEPGIYDVEIDIGRKRVALKFEDDNSENSKYRFYYPDDFDMPERDGETAFISSKDSRQPYDLRIAVDKEYTSSDLRTEYESCSYTRPVQRCGYRYGRYDCWMEHETVWGQRYVEYYVVTEDTQYTAYLSYPGNDQSVADFEGHEYRNSKDYLRADRCW